MDEIISSISSERSANATSKQARQSRAVNWGAIDDELSSLLTDLETKVAPKRASTAAKPTASNAAQPSSPHPATPTHAPVSASASVSVASASVDNLSELDALISGLTTGPTKLPARVETPAPYVPPAAYNPPVSIPEPAEEVPVYIPPPSNPRSSLTAPVAAMPACDELEYMLSRLEGQMNLGDAASDIPAYTPEYPAQQEQHQPQVETPQPQPPQQQQQQQPKVEEVQESGVSLDAAYYEELPPLPSDPNICGGCSVQVNEDSDAFAMACDRKWHMEHFKCTACSTDLCGVPFYEKYGRPYCAEHFSSIFSPKCGRCKKPILGEYVQTGDVSYHSDCFTCETCSKQFGSNPYFMKEGKYICQSCFLDTAIRCASCNEPITGRYIMALGKHWHPEHFSCTSCKTQIPMGSGYKQKDNLPYCPKC